MKRKKIAVIIAAVLIFFTGAVLESKQALAASATVSITTGDSTLTVDDIFTVTLTVKSDADMGGFETYLTYNEEVLEFQKSGKLISGGEGLLKVADLNSDNVGTTKKYTMKFKAISAGTSEISVQDKAYVYEFETENEMSVSVTRLSVSIVGKQTAGDSTELTSLKINPGVLEPAFEQKITEYKTTVKPEITELIISAAAKDSKAVVEIKGNQEFISGENKVTVTVKAESGKTQDYNIIVTKEEKEEPEETPKSDENQDTQGEHFKVEEKDGKTIIQNSYALEVTEVEDESIVPEGYIKTKVILYGISIAAYTKENDLADDFLLIYAMNQEGEKNFYQYDRVEKTMQRYEGKISYSQSGNTQPEQVMTSGQYQSKLNQMSIIIAVLSALSALLIIGIIKLFMKVKGMNDDELD